jgi:hypothetical protein
MSIQRSTVAFLSALGVAWITIGCVGSFPVGRSVQRGSSFLVPVAGYGTETAVPLGFGRPQQPGPPNNPANAAWPDLQRGELQFFVDDGADPGEVFLLRAVSVAGPSIASSFARGEGLAANTPTNTEVAALLDVPLDAPLGPQVLRYRHVVHGGNVSLGVISVLPNKVLLCEPSECNATPGIPTVTGSTTSSAGAARETVPDPQIIIPFPANAHAVQLTVVVPKTAPPNPQPIAQIVDAFEHRTDRSAHLAWTSLAEEFPGSYAVSAVATLDSGIDALALVFQLTGATTLDPGDVLILTLTARDRFGEPIDGFDELDVIPTVPYVQ